MEIFLTAGQLFGVLSLNFFLSSWVWSEAGAQSDLESALDIGGFGYPAMAVVNTKKMKYSILRGSFSSDGIKEFLRSVVYLIFCGFSKM